jgi:hypothetical protein
MGWIGIMRQLLYYLSVVGADRDADGKYVVGGSITSITTFMGMGGEDAEVVVGEDAFYTVGGGARKVNLAAGLRSTSMGLGVKVIM